MDKIPQPEKLDSLEDLRAYLNTLATRGFLFCVTEQPDANAPGKTMTNFDKLVSASVNGPSVQLETAEFVRKVLKRR